MSLCSAAKGGRFLAAAGMRQEKHPCQAARSLRIRVTPEW